MFEQVIRLCCAPVPWHSRGRLWGEEDGENDGSAQGLTVNASHDMI